ncbi:hypothetical protein [Microbacterium pumilum]|uniref:Uncharacterized protein n=1 Tax=Microbacterium pumilum TaxID=344165 RepID=A0ABP5E7P7_9MICO
MAGSRVPSGDAGELRKLQARAYGPDADLFGDPEGLARLAELEAGRLDAADFAEQDDAEVEQPTDAEPDAAAEGASSSTVPTKDSLSSVSARGSSQSSSRRRLGSRRSARIGLAVGAVLAVIAIAWGVTRLFGPHPDATLWATTTANEFHEQFVPLIYDNRLFRVDRSTLVSYETYRGVEPWSVIDEFGNPCLLLEYRSAEIMLELACTPREADLIVDLAAWPVQDPDFAEGLPDGSVLRFQYHDNSVDAFLITPPADD